jgi:hypothetical protein
MKIPKARARAACRPGPRGFSCRPWLQSRLDHERRLRRRPDGRSAWLGGRLPRRGGLRRLRFRCGQGAYRPHADRYIQTSQLARLQHADTDHLTRQLLAALVADLEHDKILTRLGGDLVGNAAIDTERAIAFVVRTLGGIRTKAQMVPAPGTDRRGFKDGRLAMRTDASGPRRARAKAAHTERGVPLSSTAACFSSQPNST